MSMAKTPGTIPGSLRARASYAGGPSEWRNPEAGPKQRVDQTVDRLAVRGRNLREALTSLELRAKLRFGYPDVADRGLEAPEPEMAEAAMKTADKRKVARRDALLERVTFCLRDAPRGDRGIDTVVERLLQGVAQFARRDTELLCGIVDDCLALRARRTVL